MKFRSRSKIIALILASLCSACVERIFDVPGDSSDGILVVDGFISDQPGPYFIKLSLTTTSDNVLEAAVPVRARHVIISDDAGNSESLTINQDEAYQTDANGIRGVAGRSYTLRIELTDGTVFESKPDKLLSGGKIDSLYYQWESTKPLDGPTTYGFRIFMDGQADNANSFTRWRFKGYYLAQSFPELNKWEPNCSIPPDGDGSGLTPDPLPCSGYITTGIRNPPFFVTRGEIIQISDCTCCLCWITDSEDSPKLSNDIISTQGIYDGLEIGFVPFNEWTFDLGKYLVTVEQMNLSKDAFAFWKIISDQKNGAASLFQPSFGKPTTNLISINSDRQVIGFFYATGIIKKALSLSEFDAPIPVPDHIEIPKENCALWRDCTSIFPFSSYTKPVDWKD